VRFGFTGKLNKLTVKIDRPQLTPEDIKKLEAATRNNKASELRNLAIVCRINARHAEPPTPACRDLSLLRTA